MSRISQVDYPTRAIRVKLSSLLKSEEFAQQIYFLNSTQMDRAMPKTKKVGAEFSEDRNVPHPMYLSQWLMAAVSNRSTKVNDEFPVISKKMRDEVIKGKENLPFRRSGLWISLKVFLQLGLTVEVGENMGKLFYKCIMARFMSEICCHDELNSLDDDIRIQMVAKLARRMDKIDHYTASNLDPGSIKRIKSNMTLCRKRIQMIRERLNKNLSDIYAKECQISCLTAMPRLQFDRDIVHQMPKVLQYIKLREADVVSNTIHNNVTNNVRITRHLWDDLTLPDVSLLNVVSGEIDVLQLLADIEHWVLVILDERYRDCTADNLRQLATAYMSKAQAFYENDCVGYSKMVLVMLKLIQVNSN